MIPCSSFREEVQSVDADAHARRNLDLLAKASLLFYEGD